MNANHRFSETLFDGQNKLRHEPYLTKCWMLAINSGMKPQSGRGIDRMSTLANTFLMMKACRNRSPGFCAFTSETHTVGVRIPSQLRRREEIQKCWQGFSRLILPMMLCERAICARYPWLWLHACKCARFPRYMLVPKPPTGQFP